jgi:hypothetical protein
MSKQKKARKQEQASRQENVVAVICPWDKLAVLAKKKFRAESLPDRNVMVWRDDLDTPEKLSAELQELGVEAIAIRTGEPTDWKEVE